jgi:hypothetical protein
MSTKKTFRPARVNAVDAIEESLALNRTRQWLYGIQTCSGPFKRRLLVLAGPLRMAASHAVEAWPWETYDQLPRRVAFQDILGPWHHSPAETIGYDNRTGLNKLDLLTTPLLMLDGVGAEVGEGSSFGEVLSILLRSRCDGAVATVVTTDFECPTDSCRRCRRPILECDGDENACDGAGARGHGAVEANTIPGLLRRYGSHAERIEQRFIEFGEWVHCPDPTEKNEVTRQEKYSCK